ncbi:hypothetical protein [Pseudoclavibacter sp. CFCC 11306]|uniref:hypothetical protein n=1 Tax=Pseudoclavibacter sp. CFCC 11306 TaxID=1564493 RepID=UPI001300CFEE|nr:hypothetical protein [Pseudoclavibacter sp. CFCC 11306]KAB1659007.1 hypothetical protein F8O09_05430 [Pseudoclavibacter sp. CFCC 11306]
MRIDRYLPHRNLVTEHLYEGSGPDGDNFQTLTVPRALIVDKVMIVRDKDGVETTSTCQVAVPLNYLCTPGSEITLWAGTEHERRTKVIAAARAEYSAATPNHATLYCE